MSLNSSMSGKKPSQCTSNPSEKDSQQSQHPEAVRAQSGAPPPFPREDTAQGWGVG